MLTLLLQMNYFCNYETKNLYRYFDRLFTEDTRVLFDKVFNNEIILVTSSVLIGEVDLAPQNGKDFLARFHLIIWSL